MLQNKIRTVLLMSILIIGLTSCGSGNVQVSPSGAQLVAISLAPTDSVIAKDTTQTLTATGIYSDNTTQDITSSAAWTSSDTTVATVSTDALSAGQLLMAAKTGSGKSYAYGKGCGSTTVSAKAGNTSGTTTLTVTCSSLVSIAITPINPSIANGTTEQFVATGTYSDNTTQDLTLTSTWASSNTGGATINAAGLATSTAAGTTTITVTSGTISGSTTLTVNPATLSSLSVTPINPSIADGTSDQFVATGTYSDGSTQNLTATSTWSSSNTGAATINASGLATSVAAGSTAIMAVSGGKSASSTLTVTSATLASISITPSNPSSAKGTTSQFTATGTYSDGTTQNLTASVTWNSSNTTVAAISNAAGSNGLASCLATGNSTITATSGSISGSTTLTVTAATLSSLSVTPSNPSNAKGTTRQFTATGTYSDGTTQNLTASVTWSSSSTTVAAISNAAGSNGLASCLAAGNSTITATSGSISGSTTLTVTAATLSSLSVTPSNPSNVKGTTRQFTATGTYSDGTTQSLTASVTWSSSGTTVAAISNAAGSNGLASCLAAGTSTITATSGSISGASTLTVTAATLSSIAVTPVNPSLATGTTQQFTATGTYSDGSTQNLTTSSAWSSSNTGAATISASGLATSAAAGSTTITATSGGVSATTVLTVTTTTSSTVAISAASGVFSNGNILTVSGANFGTPRTAQYYNYFDDYTSDWSCAPPSTYTCDSVCGSFPSHGTAFSGESQMSFSCQPTGDYYMQIGGGPHALFNFSKDYSNFTTGRSFWNALKYYAGGQGGLPNSKLSVPSEASTTEFVAITYVYWGPQWTQNPQFEKIIGIWSGDYPYGFGMLVDAGNQRVDYQVGETGGDNASIDAPTTPLITRGGSNGKWHEIKLHSKKQTPGQTDGIVQLWVDGALVINDSTAKPIGDAATFFNYTQGGLTLSENVQCGGTGVFTCASPGDEWVRAYGQWFMNESSTDPSGGVFPAIATVYLSNSATWGTGPTDMLNGDANFVRQKVGGTANADLGYKSWGNTQFKFQVNTTGLNASSPVYLYVTPWSGQTNATGFLLQ